MRLYKEIDILNNKKSIIWLNIISIVLIVVFGVLFSFLSFVINPDFNLVEDYTFSRMVILLIVYFALIVIHELIHGIFFKLFAPDGKVTFGFKNGMAYAASIGNRYSKGKYAVIILAPFVFITSGLTLLHSLQIIDSFLYVLSVSMHAASCVGDFYYIALLMRAPKNIVVEDTSIGMSMFFK